MKKLLFHVSDNLYDVLKPQSNDGCIYFSEGCFIGSLGQYLYIFDYQTLAENFYIKERYSAGQVIMVNMPYDTHYIYESQPLQREYLIFQAIDVEKYALCIAENFNVLKGTLKRIVTGEVIEREKVYLMERRSA